MKVRVHALRPPLVIVGYSTANTYADTRVSTPYMHSSELDAAPTGDQHQVGLSMTIPVNRPVGVSPRISW